MSFAEGIRSGRLEVNPHLTPEQRRGFDEMATFLDRATARGVTRIEAERRALINAGRMTEDGVLIDPPPLGSESSRPSDSLPDAAPENRLSPDAQPQIDRMLRGLNDYVRHD